ncbi:MAG: glycerol-3-phosphate acyltransferase [Chloroflexi bacterium]|nr:glycerol-3-phosphate acyltransferase [Chloroflexota bacterium]
MVNGLAVLFVIGSYLLGSIPSAYLVGKWSKGKDITRAGTGTTGAANVWQTVSHGAGAAAFLADMIKGALPPFLGQLLGLGLTTAVSGALASVIGHNWSVFLGFKGGRGIATVVGAFLVLAPREGAVSILTGLLGTPFRQTAPFVLAGVAVFPALSWYSGAPYPLMAAGTAIWLVIVIKRLEANRRPMTPGAHPWQVLWYRFIYDRDVRDRKEWLKGRGEE